MRPILTLPAFCCLLFVQAQSFAQPALIANTAARISQSLNGEWQYLVDPYETGFYDYRYKERSADDPEAYWSSDQPKNKMDRKEHGYTNRRILKVPGDWNSQDPRLLYYEGTVWYKRSFDFHKTDASSRIFLYFGGANYRADIYLNGKKLGMHKGGFTPFNFEVPDTLLKARDNYLVVKVDNKRAADEVPTLNTDWWNYGGLTRDVRLVQLPARSAILDYSLGLARSPADTQTAGASSDATVAGTPSPDTRPAEATGWVQLANASDGEQITVEIPELKIKEVFPVKDNRADLRLRLSSFQAWTPETPRRYQVIISGTSDHVEESIGLRTIRVQGDKILLNGKPVFLRGISLHEEVAWEGRRANSRADAVQLLSLAKELGCNMVRLAHYPHNEYMARVADSLGLMIWSEIPVYWTIEFSNPEVLEKARKQLSEMIALDHNRASIIIWSVGNETPVSEARTQFMKTLLEAARGEDPSRLVSAALEVNYHSGNTLRTIDDPLGQYVDVIAFNEYLGWYGGTPVDCREARWTTQYDKPLFISETGAEALGGFHADSLTLWSEEFQEWFYKEQIAMLKKMPDNFTGISPWVLVDFRSPRRNNPTYQDGWNNKGLVDQKGRKKKAFFVLKRYYTAMKKGI